MPSAHVTSTHMSPATVRGHGRLKHPKTQEVEARHDQEVTALMAPDLSLLLHALDMANLCRSGAGWSAGVCV